MQINRRDFGILAGAGVGAVATGLPMGQAAWSQRKRIAFLGTEVRQHSHAQHFLDRHAMGYTYSGKWQEPRFDIASVFIDQFPEGDLAKQRISKYQLRAYTSVEEALTLGTSKLAVDGVVIIAEHGDYPMNEKGQRRYPRYDWFKKVVRVFEDSGRSVPVFNDKHLSTVWSECKEMVEDSKRLQFPFLAGSSLPVTWRLPATEIAIDTPMKESVCVCYGGVDSYDFHGLETAQCMSERRLGGESGVKRVVAVKGERVWQELEQAERADTQRLFVAALTRSHNLPVEGGFPTAPVTYQWAKQAMRDTVTAYLIEHNDGFRTGMFLCPIRDFNYAGLRSDNGEVVSCQMYLPMPTHGSTTADFFNPLARHIEDVVLTGKTPYPIERTLLTSGLVIAAVDSLFQKQVAIDTPHLAVKYKANAHSAFWQV